MTVFVLWDWDATLADTYPVINAAHAYTFEKLGMKNKMLSVDEIKKKTSTLQNKDVFEAVYGADKKNEARNFYYEYIRANHLEFLEPIEGAYATLEYLANIGAVQLLLSNKSNINKDGRGKFLTEETDKLEMSEYFSTVCGAGEEVEDKPSPIAVDALIKKSPKLPTKNDLILVVGDGEADMKVAEHLKKMGLKARSILLDPKKKYKGSVRPNYTVSELNTLPIIVRNETNGVAERARQLARSKNR